VKRVTPVLIEPKKQHVRNSVARPRGSLPDPLAPRQDTRPRFRHYLEPIKELRYPRRLVFYDSESYLLDRNGKMRVYLKPEAGSRSPIIPDAARDGDITFHEPRLIVAEYWERKDNDYELVNEIPFTTIVPEEKTVHHRNGVTETRTVHHRHVERTPVFPNNGAFREGDFKTPRGGANYRALCRAFWESVDRLASARAVNNADTCLNVIAHNHEYDYAATAAMIHLTDLGWTLEQPYHKGPVFICKATKGHHVIKLVSSTNWFHTSLKRLAKDMGTEKLDFHDFNSDDVGTLETYCRRDVEIVRLACLWLTKTFESENLGPWRDTIASMTFAMFRYRFMKHRIWIHTIPEAIAIERAGLAGGRTEAWGLGTMKGPIYCLDANNLYGYAMHEMQVPIRILEVTHDDHEYQMPPMLAPRDEGALALDEREVARLFHEMNDLGHGAVAEVDIEISKAVAPRKSGKLLFPIGQFRTTLCGPELREVIRSGGKILKAGRVCYYQMAPIFREAVDYLSEKREEASKNHRPAERQLFKDLVTNLYGKFSQRKEEWERTGPYDSRLHFGRMLYHFQEYDMVTLNIPSGFYVLQNRVPVESRDAFPAVSAYITSFARTHFNRLREIANGLDGHHVLYGDTDSLFVDQVGWNRLAISGWIDPTRLGYLKQEWQADWVKISGAKVYDAMVVHEPHLPNEHPKHEDCVEGEGGVPVSEPHRHLIHVFKGIPLSRAELVETPEGQFSQYEQFAKLDSLIASGNVERTYTRVIRKKMSVEYTKSRHVIIDLSKWVWLDPWRLPDDAVVALPAEAV